MMLARSVGRPRASLEERTLSWDEVQQALRSAFFSGEEPDTGQSGAGGCPQWRRPTAS